MPKNVKKSLFWFAFWGVCLIPYFIYLFDWIINREGLLNAISWIFVFTIFVDPFFYYLLLGIYLCIFFGLASDSLLKLLNNY